jgi:CheY-like chemotaxis protein
MAEKLKILVVEDNDFVRMQIARFLTDAEYDVVESVDGNDAFEKLSEDISLAIVDVRMEPVGGFEFIRNMRSMEIKTPVVLVTGDNDPELLNDASRLGVSAVLMKPVERERLVKTVSRTVQSRARS